MSKTKRREEELRRIVQQASENLIDVGSMNSLGVGFPSQAMVTNSSSGQVSALQTDIRYLSKSPIIEFGHLTYHKI